MAKRQQQIITDVSEKQLAKPSPFLLKNVRFNNNFPNVHTGYNEMEALPKNVEGMKQRRY